MSEIDPRRVADILEGSPMMARLGLTASNAAVRAKAAEKIARLIVGRLEEPEPPIVDERQMALFIS